MSDLVLMSVSDHVATLTLNRPNKLNALNYALIDQLMRRLDDIEPDDAIRAVVMTGSGDHAFSAGADIVEFRESVRRGSATAVRDFVRRGQTMTGRLEAFSKPVIVAVNGLAFGGGCEITEAAHLAVASDQASFAKPEIKLGMPPTFGGTQRLPRLAGRKLGLELLLTGDAFSPTHALNIGLVNEVVPHRNVLTRAMELAARVIRHSPQSVQSVITAVTRGLNASVGEGLQIESEQFARLVPTPDLREGLDAWLSRRPAVFSGR